MSEFNKTLWSNKEKDRFFLISDDTDLESGSYLLRTSTGREKHVQIEHIEQYELSKEDSHRWLKAELSSVSAKLRGNLQKHADKKRDGFPDKLAEIYQQRSDGGSKQDLADVLTTLTEKSEAIPDRMKARMKEIAERLVAEKDRKENK